MNEGRFTSWEAAVEWLRQQPDQRQLVLDAYYDDPLQEAAERYWRSDEWMAARGLFGAGGGHVLDIGAGRGIASYALARDGYVVTAMEPDGSEIVGAGAIRSLAVSTALPIEVIQHGSQRLPFPDASFDLVFARAVLHHLPGLPGAVREMHRVLKPGGRLVAIREHVISRQSDLEVFLAQHPLHRFYGGENAYLLGEYVAALTKAGFELQRVLGPLDSPVNFAPRTEAELRAEIAARIGGPGRLGKALQTLLSRRTAWRAVRCILASIDDRPGRHYSFVAIRR